MINIIRETFYSILSISKLINVPNKKIKILFSVLLSNLVVVIDIGIIYGTSIAHHFLLKKIPFIVPKFIDNNENIYDLHKVCYAPKNQNDLLHPRELFCKLPQRRLARCKASLESSRRRQNDPQRRPLWLLIPGSEVQDI